MASVCTNCGTNPANRGRKWCQPCWLAGTQLPPPPTPETAIQSSPKLCSQCRATPANPGRSWCQQCWEREKGGGPKCRQCQRVAPVFGYELCTNCYEKSRVGLRLVPTEEIDAEKQRGIIAQFNEGV